MSGGIILAERATAAIPTPGAGKITIFPDSETADVLAWKTSDGVVHRVPDLTSLAAGYQPLAANLTNLGALATDPRIVGIPFVMNNGTVVLATGVQPGNIVVPFNCVIVDWTVLLDQSGSIVVDIWKDTYANYPPVVGDSITASAKPTVTAATKGQSSTLTGWTTTITAGDTLRFNIDSVTSALNATLNLKVRRT